MEIELRTIEHKIVEEKYVELKQRGRISLSIEKYKLQKIRKDDNTLYNDRCLLIADDTKYIVAESYETVKRKLGKIKIKGFQIKKEK